jgi:hypothetical protein
MKRQPMRLISSAVRQRTKVLPEAREAPQIVSQQSRFGVSSAQTSMVAWPYNKRVNLTACAGHAPCLAHS